MTSKPSEWVSISQYARIYGIGRPTVYKWLRGGVLEHYKVDWCVRIRNLPPSQQKKSILPPVAGC